MSLCNAEGNRQMATITEFLGSLNLFNDEVFSSTDLARKTGEVLNHARKAPVTISRNGEQFALLKRDRAAGLINAVYQFGPTIELVEGALTVIEGKETSPTLAWLKAFDKDDIDKMIREVLVSSSIALKETGDWDAVASVIHEWHESALLVLSGAFETTMEERREEIPLTDPSTILETEGCPRKR